MELKHDARSDLNLGSEVEVLTYTYSGVAPLEVIARIDLGNGSKLLSGAGGTYALRFLINNVQVMPSSTIDLPSTQTKAVMVSREVPIVNGDVVRLMVTGLGGDTDVNTVATLRDATSTTMTDISGPGAVSVDHNYGGTDALSYQTEGGVAIDNAIIQVFTKSDWDAGNQEAAFVVAFALTTTDRGRWSRPVFLDPGMYVLRYFKQNVYGPDLQNLTVS